MKSIITIFLSIFCISAFAQYDCIPFKEDAVLHLDGTIQNISGNYYLVDRSGNNRNFLITGYDISYLPNNYKGLPYKSLATVSAPAADATLIAADVNNFMYTSGGTPKAIPVTAFFQNVDYANKIFSRHTSQVVDSTSKEVAEPFLLEFVVYNTVKSGTDLSKCNEYYRVPEKQSESVTAWLAENGNDATGAGTEASPWRSLDKIKSTTKTYVYLKSGNYDMGATVVTWTGSALTLQGLGNVSFYVSSNATGTTFSRPMTINNCEIKDTSSTAIVYSQDLTFNRCKLVQTKGASFANCSSTGKNITLNSCIVSTTFRLFSNSGAIGTMTINGCYGNLLVNSLNTSRINGSTVLKYNKGLSAPAMTFPTAAFTFKDNKNLGTLTLTNIASRVRFTDEIINYNLSFSDSVVVNRCTITGNITGTKMDSLANSTINGTLNLTAKNNFVLKGCTFNAATGSQPINITAAANANVTGLIIDSNTVNGNKDASFFVYIGGVTEPLANCINGAQITRNRITNASTTGTGTTHTLFAGGGTNYSIKYNDITANSGYGMVIKAGGGTYTDTGYHIAYNVLRFTAPVFYAIYDRGANGLKVANNTFIDFRGTDLFRSDSDFAGSLANSMLVINNLITLAGNVGNISQGANTTSRNNYINRNGYTCNVGANDYTTTTVLPSTGVPPSRQNGGEITNTPIGLATTYSIPTNVIYQSQDATWQVGAIIF